MIIGNRQCLNELLNLDLLKVKENIHVRYWDYYYEQYRKAFCVLLGVAKHKNYHTNRKFMPFLFLMRHSLELYLKREILRTGIAVPNTHNIRDLYEKAGLQDQSFLEAFDCLKCDSDGGCWRYLFDKKRNPYFKQESIDATEACYYYDLLLNNENLQVYTDRVFQWELTFHTGECHSLDIVATQYDFAIQDLLTAVLKEEISINDIYLPLLFLLRHSLEIKLKAAIIELGRVVKEKCIRKFYSTHPIKELYKILFCHIDVAVGAMPDGELKIESEKLRRVVQEYQERIQSLDANSYVFRFPCDREGSITNFMPNTDVVSDILKLHWESDSFLCFAVPVLFMEGVLVIGEEKEREYYE